MFLWMYWIRVCSPDVKQAVDEYLSGVAHFRTKSMSDLLDIVEEDVDGEVKRLVFYFQVGQYNKAGVIVRDFEFQLGITP